MRSDAQRERTKALFEAMKAETIPLGERLLVARPWLTRSEIARLGGLSDAEAATDGETAHRVRRRVTEEAVEHLFLPEQRFLAERAGDVGHHLRLDLPHHRQVRNDGEPAGRPWRQ